jgi:hypothetical protein
MTPNYTPEEIETFRRQAARWNALMRFVGSSGDDTLEIDTGPETFIRFTANDDGSFTAQNLDGHASFVDEFGSTHRVDAL